MPVVRNILLSICLISPAAFAFDKSGAEDDIKAAGGSAKVAVVKTGSATGKASLKGAKKTGKGLKWSLQKLALGAGFGVEKGGVALKSVGK
jgi:hypothetical protein